MKFLRRHPFGVRAFLDTSVVLGFAAPVEAVARLVPHPLQPDRFKERWGFIVAAAVNTRKLRPKMLPEFLGNDFILVGYRVFVRYRTSSGRNLRGLYILGSETDSPRMKWLGSLFTTYRYRISDIHWQSNANRIEIGNSTGLDIAVEQGDAESAVPLPVGSPFSDWREARRFAGPMPFTFSVEDGGDRVTMVEGVRRNWKPAPLHVARHRIPFIDSLEIDGLRLANAFVVEQAPYEWKRGVIDRPRPEEAASPA